VNRTRKGQKENSRRVQITRRPGERNAVPPSDRRDQRKPKTAIGRFLSKNSQPRLTDLALNDISTGHSPTPVYLHEPSTKSLCLHQQRQNKRKERTKKKHTTSTSATLGGKNTPAAQKARRQNNHHWGKRPRVNETQAQTAKGTKIKKQDREEEARGLPPRTTRTLSPRTLPFLFFVLLCLKKNDFYIFIV
jgi:hypothetical protein